MIKDKLQITYPSVFEDDLLNEINQSGTLVQFKANDVMIDFNQQISGIPIILSGAVKIMREDFNEGELLLYFLERGDVCALTMSSYLGHNQSNVRGVAEIDGELVFIPISKMDEWLVKYTSWRRFIFESYNNRIDELLVTVDNLAFNNLNERLKHYLLNVASINKGTSINKTHQEIADELNTSRVVISRLLKVLEKEGFLCLNRHQIILQ